MVRSKLGAFLSLLGLTCLYYCTTSC